MRTAEGISAVKASDEKEILAAENRVLCGLKVDCRLRAWHPYHLCHVLSLFTLCGPSSLKIIFGKFHKY